MFFKQQQQQQQQNSSRQFQPQIDASGLSTHDAYLLQSIAQRTGAIIITRPVNRGTLTIMRDDVVPKDRSMHVKTSNFGPQNGYVPKNFCLRRRSIAGNIDDLAIVHCKTTQLRLTALQIEQLNRDHLLQLKKNGHLAITPTEINKSKFHYEAHFDPESTTSHIELQTVKPHWCSNNWGQYHPQKIFKLYVKKIEEQEDFEPLAIYCNEQGLAFVSDCDIALIAYPKLSEENEQKFGPIHQPFNTSVDDERRKLVKIINHELREYIDLTNTEINDLNEFRKIFSDGIKKNNLKNLGRLSAFEFLCLTLANQTMENKIQHGPENHNPNQHGTPITQDDKLTVFAPKNYFGQDSQYQIIHTLSGPKHLMSLLEMMHQGKDCHKRKFTMHISWQQYCRNTKSFPKDSIETRRRSSCGSSSLSFLEYRPDPPIESDITSHTINRPLTPV